MLHCLYLLEIYILTLSEGGGGVNMAEIGTGKPSPVAMLLSFVCPGLGQLYLRKIKKALVLFLVAAMGFLIIYVNSS